MTDSSFWRLLAVIQNEINHALNNNASTTPIHNKRARHVRNVAILEKQASEELSERMYSTALTTGAALMSLGHLTQGLRIVGDSFWGMHRVNKAILAYSAALKCKAEDDHTQLAASRIEAARTYVRKRRDPLLCLPDELVSEIFSFLDTQSRVACTAVSRTWRPYALSPFTWKRLDVRLRSDYDITDAYIDSISRYMTPQLAHLTIYSDVDTRDFMSLVEDKNCLSLKTLELLRRNSRTIGSDTSLPRKYFCDRFFRSLQLVGQRLVHLHIALSVGTLSTHTLCLVLDTCPALECLDCRKDGMRLDDRDDVHEPNLSLGERRQPYPLKYLSWPIESSICRDPDFIPSKLPNLEILILYQSLVFPHRHDFSPFLERLSKLNLKVLKLGHDADKSSVHTYASGHNTKEGIRCLGLSHVPVSDAALKRLLLRHQNTLQDFVSMTWEPAGQDYGGPGANIQGMHFPELRRVHIVEQSESLPAIFRPLPNFFEACTSALTSVTIVQHLFDLSSARALLNFPYLKHASIYELGSHPQQAMEPMVAFVRGLAKQKTACPLQVLDLAIGLSFDEDYEKLFVAAGKIASLQSFKVVPGTLVHRNPALSVKAVARFIRHAVRSGLAENLKHIKFVLENGDIMGVEHDHYELAKANLYAAFPHLEEIAISIA